MTSIYFVRSSTAILHFHQYLDMPALDITQHKYFTVVALLILGVAFFPGLPHFLAGLPLRLLTYPFNAAPPPPTVIQCPTGCIPVYNSGDMSGSWFQKTFTLPAKSRGSYLITDHVVSSIPEIKDYKVGLLTLFVQHTSCALSLNENWDSDVREDMSDALDRIAPEDRKGNLYRHSAEGLDDMPVSSPYPHLGCAKHSPICTGAYQICTYRCKCYGTDYGRKTKHRHLARYMVS